MTFEKSLSKKLRSKLDKKQDTLQKQPAVFARNVTVPNQINFNYVVIGDNIMPVYNDRVPARPGVKIWVGYDAIDQTNKKPKRYQVLGTRSEEPAGGQAAQLGYAPSKRYEHNAEGGGQDVLAVHLRAITFLKTGVSKIAGNVQLYRGRIWSGTEFINVATQNVDISAQVPSTPGKAALVMITIDTTGAVIQTKGSEVDIGDLTTAERPAVPADTAFVSCCVRVYEGQVKPQEGRVNTDFDDLRFAWHPAGGGVQSVVAGTNVTVDDTDPDNPIVSASGGVTNGDSHDHTGGDGGTIAYASISDTPARGWEIISDTILGADAANFDLTSIPQTYKHLKLIITARGTEATTYNFFRVRFNNDSGANYNSQLANASATAFAGAEALSQTSGQAGGYACASSGLAGSVGQVEFTIPDYTNTAFKKTMQHISFVLHKVTTGGGQTFYGGVLWNSTAAISRITLLPTANNFLAGSRVTLYGVS